MKISSRVTVAKSWKEKSAQKHIYALLGHSPKHKNIIFK